MHCMCFSNKTCLHCFVLPAMHRYQQTLLAMFNYYYKMIMCCIKYQFPWKTHHKSRNHGHGHIGIATSGSPHLSTDQYNRLTSLVADQY